MRWWREERNKGSRIKIELLKFVNHSHNFTLPPRNFFRTWASGWFSYTSNLPTYQATAGRLPKMTQRRVVWEFHRADHQSIPKLSAKLLTLAVCWSACSLEPGPSGQATLLKFLTLILSLREMSGTDLVLIKRVRRTKDHFYGQFTSHCQHDRCRWQSFVRDGPLLLGTSPPWFLLSHWNKIGESRSFRLFN